MNHNELNLFQMKIYIYMYMEIHENHRRTRGRQKQVFLPCTSHDIYFIIQSGTGSSNYQKTATIRKHISNSQQQLQILLEESITTDILIGVKHYHTLYTYKPPCAQYLQLRPVLLVEILVSESVCISTTPREQFLFAQMH